MAITKLGEIHFMARYHLARYCHRNRWVAPIPAVIIVFLMILNGFTRNEPTVNKELDLKRSLKDAYRDEYFRNVFRTFGDMLSDTDNMTFVNEHRERFQREAPNWETASGFFSGAGIVMLCGTPDDIPPAIVNIVNLRTNLKTNVPIEIWHTDLETISPKIAFQLATMNVAVRVFPISKLCPNGQFQFGNFATKVFVLMMTSFDRVMFMDSDIYSVMDPEPLLQSTTLAAEFWPDFFSYWRVGLRIWDSLGGIPHSLDLRTMDSSVLVICKSCGGWRPLLLAAYMNFHGPLYYSLIYKNPTTGIYSYGAGDKDTFLISWELSNATYFLHPYPFAIGVQQGSGEEGLCVGNMGHRTREGELFAIHHTSNKWLRSSWGLGCFAGGLGLTHSGEIRNSSWRVGDENSMDGDIIVKFSLHQKHSLKHCVRFPPGSLTIQSLDLRLQAGALAIVDQVYSWCWLDHVLDGNRWFWWSRIWHTCWKRYDCIPCME